MSGALVSQHRTISHAHVSAHTVNNCHAQLLWLSMTWYVGSSGSLDFYWFRMYPSNEKDFESDLLVLFAKCRVHQLLLPLQRLQPHGFVCGCCSDLVLKLKCMLQCQSLDLQENVTNFKRFTYFVSHFWRLQRKWVSKYGTVKNDPKNAKLLCVLRLKLINK